jgi:hypothetical protein
MANFRQRWRGLPVTFQVVSGGIAQASKRRAGHCWPAHFALQFRNFTGCRNIKQATGN